MILDLAALPLMALKLVVALLLGSAIGFERQWNQKMAGLRTNALVGLGACGFVAFSGLVGEGDPTRVAGQVVPDTSKVTVTAQAVAGKRTDQALEQIVGRLSLEPTVSGATWQVDRSIPEA